MFYFIFFIVFLLIACYTVFLVKLQLKQHEEKKKYKEVKKYAQSVMDEMGIGNKKDRDLKVKQAIETSEKAVKKIEERIKAREVEYKIGVFENPDDEESYEPFYTKIVGVTRGKRQEYLQECYEGQELTIKWDVNNKYSEHALVVYVEIDGRKKQLGFIPDETAKDLVEKYFFDEDYVMDANISEITGGTEDKPTLGCNIEIMI